jgi:phosphoribosylanthranilate isomerase
VNPSKRSTSSIFVKICGITRLEDALLVAKLGGDAIGFIFYPVSKRFISNAQAAPIAEAARKSGLGRVGVFVNPTLNTLEETVRTVNLNFIQLHGTETPEFVAEVKAKFPSHQIIKAVRLDSSEANARYDADFELLDSPSAEWGGSGQTVPFSKAQEYVSTKKTPVILAGGLTAQNLRQAIDQVNPAGIDLSSGVEISPGIKSQEKLEELFHTLGKGSSS